MATSVKMEVGQWSKVWHDPMVGVFGCMYQYKKVIGVLQMCFESRCHSIPCQKGGRHEQKKQQAPQNAKPN